jgi:prepilin signal peptidase PulO-like enzyme (type II secretory pathway)
MTVVFAIVLVVHGLIHVLGFVKAFGLAELPQLTQPVSPSLGALWLLAALLFLAAAAALFVWPRGWWAIGACAIVVSMFLIVPSWTDAKFGALANLVALIGVVLGFLVRLSKSSRHGFASTRLRPYAHARGCSRERQANRPFRDGSEPDCSAPC